MHIKGKEGRNMHSAKKTTDGAMMVAIVGLLLLLNRQFAGIIEYAMYWILSFPILVYTIKYGWKGAMIPAAAMMAEAFMLSLPTTVFYLASALLCGILYGHGVKKHWPNGVNLLITGILTFLSYLITMVLFATVFGYDPNEDIQIAEQLIQIFGFAHENLAQVILFYTLLLSVVTAILQTICVHLLAMMLLTRLHIPTQPLKSVYDIRMPHWLSWISICIWLLFLSKNVLKLEGIPLAVILVVYVISCMLMCAETLLDILSLHPFIKRRIFLIGMSLICIAGLFWLPTQWIIYLFGVYSIHQELRQKWKRGVWEHGTIGKL